MRKNLLILLALIFSSLSVQAQLDFSVSPVDVTGEANVGPQGFKASCSITNTTNSNLSLTWDQTSVVIESGWNVAVCDKNQCWNPVVTSKNFDLAPNETGELSIVFYPNNIEGTGKVELRVFDQNDPNTSVSNVYNGITSRASTSTVSLTEAQMSIYPNPASDYIVLSDENQEVSTMVFYSLIGREIKRFDVNSTKGKYDISQMPKGIYLIRLLDNSNKVVGTKRLNKR